MHHIFSSGSFCRSLGFTARSTSFSRLMEHCTLSADRGQAHMVSRKRTTRSRFTRWLPILVFGFKVQLHNADLVVQILRDPGTAVP